MQIRSVFQATVVLLAGALTAGLAINTSAAAQRSGFVYVMTNRTTGNSVVRYARSSSGTLTELQEVSTGGLGGAGNGVGNLDPLGSQDSLVQNGSGSVLLAVNAGSNEISSLTVGNGGLALASKIPSGGEFPNSVALWGDLVYVLNAHGTPTISGFRLAADGTLSPLAGSTRALSGGSAAAPHDVRFSPDGSRLLVTEGGTNQIDIFEIGSNGNPTGVSTQASAGSGPFGMKFARGEVLANAEANSNSVSTYLLTNQNTLSVVSPAVPDSQSATCWISLTGTGHAFVSNTASGTLSSYQVANDGSLSLEHAVAATADGGAPIDSAISSDGNFLYVDDSLLGRILVFQINGTNLSAIGAVGGLPASVQGIVAQ